MSSYRTDIGNAKMQKKLNCGGKSLLTEAFSKYNIIIITKDLGI